MNFCCFRAITLQETNKIRTIHSNDRTGTNKIKWSTLTCNKLELSGKFFKWAELAPLDADDSLDSSDTVSLNAESLSGLSVRGSRNSDPLPAPLSDDVDVDDMVEFVTPEMVEFDRLCVRPIRPSAFRCSKTLSSPRIASNSAS